MRAGVGFKALFTAGEKGDAIVVLLGDCATVFPVRMLDTEPGVAVVIVSVMLIISDLGGISTCNSEGFVDGSGAGVDDVHGGAGGGKGVSEFSEGGSAAGASGISSTLDSMRGDAVVSGSTISTSTVGDGESSFAGVGSLGFTSTFGPVDMSIMDGSSSGGEGGSGEGLFDETSLSAGDLASILMDEERSRSLWSLSSCACCKSLRLNDNGGFMSRCLTRVDT